MTILRNDEWLFNISRGKVPGHSIVDKFGHLHGLGTSLATIWPQNSIYVYSATANIDSVSSSSAADTQIMRVVGLDASWNKVTQDVTLTGQATKALATPLIRISTMYNIDSTDFVGDVYAYITGATVVAGVPTVTAEIRAQIEIGDNRTLQVTYGVPDGYTAYLVHRDVSAAKGQDVEFKLFIREFGGVFQVKHPLNLNNALYEHQSLLTGVIPAKSDVEVRGITSTGTIDVSASFILILIEDGY